MHTPWRKSNKTTGNKAMLHNFNILTIFVTRYNQNGSMYTGTDPGFSVGGGANPQGEGANIQIFQKTLVRRPLGSTTGTLLIKVRFRSFYRT